MTVQINICHRRVPKCYGSATQQHKLS